MKILTSVDYEEEGRLLRRKLAPLLEARGAGAHLQVAKPEEMAAACDDDVAVAIICTPAFRTVHREAFRVLRSVGYEGPILILAKLEAPELFAQICSMPNAFLLERPYDARDLVGMVSKFVRAAIVRQRIHRRFETEEPAQVEIAGRQVRSVIRNLSKGGAYFEAEDGPLPARGTFVTLRIELKHARRTYAMPARVVWASIEKSGRPGIGVQFIGPGDVHRVSFGG